MRAGLISCQFEHGDGADRGSEASKDGAGGSGPVSGKGREGRKLRRSSAFVSEHDMLWYGSCWNVKIPSGTQRNACVRLSGLMTLRQ